MKLKETNLANIVSGMYGLSNVSKKLHIGSLNESQKSELIKVYNALGGCLKDVPVRFGSWDIITDNFIIELDEEQHFNRYRKATLESPLYDNYKWFDVETYKSYCTLKEDKCLKKAKRGGYWTNASTERQFGTASENGDFSGNGSPRWKQRAFYDFCRDLYSTAFGIPVYRFSIYDEIVFRGGKIALGTALEQFYRNAITNYLETKISG